MLPCVRGAGMLCTKCKIRLIHKPVEYDGDLCYICHLKELGATMGAWVYKCAMQEIKNGWFDWHTNLLKYKTGWSFVDRISFSGMFIATLKNPNLNKTPKTSKCLGDFYSKWQLDVYEGYNV